ncbi:class I SAM-dependent methyltransferase [Rhodopirellula sp. JC740]|uniref:Class I SAM-dependent methyltransferase n=2 Tax=Rhodopirellula halodulae TaxID=2894198 RepID=A0ABS8NB02_9BACT|nr:class I SAM-dependent methyltransferase [Rhodopirellula sp. JC740]
MPSSTRAVTQSPPKRKSASTPRKQSASATIDWYDRPQYFDMVFRDETTAEMAFFDEAYQRYATGTVSRVYEPGCGSGRLVAASAARGYDVIGLDNNDAMLAYLRRRLQRRKLSANLINGDMTTHVCSPQIDAAFCTFNTFRHMLDEDSAVSHLQSVADSLRPGGIYILGFHCIPMDADPDCTERWKAAHGGTQISVTLKVIDFQRRKRRETLRVSIKATKRNGVVERLRSEFPLRIYTPKQAFDLLASVDDVFEIVSVHDFDYEIDEHREMDNDLTDALFVLRKR